MHKHIQFKTQSLQAVSWLVLISKHNHFIPSIKQLLLMGQPGRNTKQTKGKKKSIKRMATAARPPPLPTTTNLLGFASCFPDSGVLRWWVWNARAQFLGEGSAWSVVVAGSSSHCWGCSCSRWGYAKQWELSYTHFFNAQWELSYIHFFNAHVPDWKGSFRSHPKWWKTVIFIIIFKLSSNHNNCSVSNTVKCLLKTCKAKQGLSPA